MNMDMVIYRSETRRRTMVWKVLRVIEHMRHEAQKEGTEVGRI